MDVCGTMSITSIHDHKYFLTMVDDFSKLNWIFILKHKSEVAVQIQSFVKNQFECSAKEVHP